MDQLITYLKIQFDRPRTGALFGTGAVLMAIGLIIGISDNPPGIGLTYLGLIFTGFSMVHHWEKARDYGTMLAISVISFPVMVLIHNIFDTINDQIGTVPVINQLLGGIAVIAFVLAVLVAPAVIVVSIFGGVFHLVKKHLT